MSHEQLTRPAHILTGLSLANLAEGIVSVYNSALSSLSLGDNLHIENNTLYFDDYPAFGIIQDLKYAPGNVGHGTDVLSEMSSGSVGNSGVGSAALSQAVDSSYSSAVGFHAGATSDSYGNSFFGALAGVVNICDFDPDGMPPFKGLFSTYVGAASSPSDNAVVAESVVGFMQRGSGQGTTTIGNGIIDSGTLTTNPGFEVFEFSGACVPNEPIPLSYRYGINIESDQYVFYLPHCGIYSFTLQVTGPQTFSLRQKNNEADTATVVTARDGLAVNWLYVGNTSLMYYLTTDHAANATLTLAVKFESMY
jgi:hypothetical protein